MKIETYKYRTDYAVDTVTTVPTQGNIIVFRRKRTPPQPGALNLETVPNSGEEIPIEVITSKGSNWIGLFEPGLDGMTGIFATPSPTTICIVIKGQAYWVPVLMPNQFEIVPCYPVNQVLPVPHAETMIFSDFTRLAAYGSEGRKWVTEDLSWDGLKIIEVTPANIRGLGWDSPKNKEVEFSVDVKTGTSIGGSSPQMY